MRRAAICGALFALTMAGCSAAPSAPTEQPTTAQVRGPLERANADIVVWTDQVTAQALKDTAEQFAAEHQISVAVQGVPPGVDIAAAYVASTRMKAGPDVVVGTHDWITEMSGPEKMVVPASLPSERLLKYSASAKQALTSGDILYGIPVAVEAPVLIRNTQLRPVAPGSVEDLLAALPPLPTGPNPSPSTPTASPTSKSTPLCIPVNGPSPAVQFESLYSSSGGYLVGQFSDGEPRREDVGLDKPGGLRAARLLSQLGKRGVLQVNLTVDEALDKFASGQCEMIQVSPQMLSTIRQGKVPYAVSMPLGSSFSAPHPYTTVHGAFISVQARKPEETRAFVLEGLTSVSALGRMSQAHPYVPAAEGNHALPQGVTGSDMAAVRASVTAGRPSPTFEGAAAALRLLGDAQRQIASGADPVETMIQTHRKITDLF